MPNRRLLPGMMVAVLVLMGIVLALKNAETPALAQTKDPCRDELGNETCDYFGINEGRINLNSETAALAGYCENGGVTLYAINGRQGDWQFNASANEIITAVTSAVNSGKAVNVRTSSLVGLVAQPSGQLVMVHYGSGYQFTFDPLRCGVNAPKGNANAVAPIPPAGQTGVNTGAGNNTGGTGNTGGAAAATPASAVEAVQADGAIVYTVQAGDTLSGIAAKYDTTVAEIRRLNSLPPDSSLIVQGAKLIVRAGTGAIVITATPLPGTTLVAPAGPTSTGPRVIIVTATFTLIPSQTPRASNTPGGRPTLSFPTAVRRTTRTPRVPPMTNTPRATTTRVPTESAPNG